MIEGYVDHFGWQIEGWAGCKSQSESCNIEIYVDDTLIKSAPADMPRLDVLEAIGLLNVGFSISLSGMNSLTGKNISVVACANDAKLKIGEFQLKQSEKVEIGQQGHLFLRNDSNFCDDYLTGKKHYSDEEAFNTAAMLRGRELLLHNAGIDLIQAVLPEKSDVLGHLRHEPLTLTSDRFIHKVIRAAKGLGAENFSFLRDFLTKEELLPRMFDKTDSHVSDFGVDIILSHLLERMMPDIHRTVRIYEEENFRGDLALTLKDDEIFEKTQRRVNRPSVVITDDTDNIISESGRLTGSRIAFSNKAPLIDCSVMVFGTSTARKFMYSLADIFRSGTMIWGANFNYREIIAIRPRLVLFVVTERIFSPAIVR